MILNQSTAKLGFSSSRNINQKELLLKFLEYMKFSFLFRAYTPLLEAHPNGSLISSKAFQNYQKKLALKKYEAASDFLFQKNFLENQEQFKKIVKEFNLNRSPENKELITIFLDSLNSITLQKMREDLEKAHALFLESISGNFFNLLMLLYESLYDLYLYYIRMYGVQFFLSLFFFGLLYRLIDIFSKKKLTLKELRKEIIFSLRSEASEINPIVFDFFKLHLLNIILRSIMKQSSTLEFLDMLVLRVRGQSIRFLIKYLKYSFKLNKDIILIYSLTRLLSYSIFKVFLGFFNLFLKFFK